MIWILYAPFAESGRAAQSLSGIFHRLCAEIKGRHPEEAVRTDEVRRKGAFFSCVRELQDQGQKVSEWHFVGCGMPFGPLMGSPEWPEAVGQAEWDRLDIPFASGARAWFYMEGSAAWFASFMAARYGINGFGCDARPKSDLSGMRACPVRVWEEDAAYDAVAALYAETFSDITVRRDETRWITEKIRQLKPAGVLDWGCGNGALLAHLAPEIKQGVGVDISSVAIEIASQTHRNVPQLAFRGINEPRLPFADHSFDMVVSLLSFRYLDWDPVLQEMERLLVPGAHILIVDMVASPMRWWELPGLIGDKWAAFRYQKKNKAFSENLRRLVAHPDWRKMLIRHPMRRQNEFEWYLRSRFPRGEMTVLNTGLRAKVLAFDSGPVQG